MAGSKPPGTRTEALAWVAETIREWRSEADVSWKPSIERLSSVLDDLRGVGVAEGLVIYIVLGCEWLLRVGKVTRTDADDILLRLETSLGGCLDSELAFWVTEVLAGPLRMRITKEGRKLLSLGTYLPMASPGMRQLFKPDEPAKRIPPKPLIPTSRGRIPWPAPWVAGALIGHILERRRIAIMRRPFKLAQALFGIRRLEPSEFDARIRALQLAQLDWWVEAFEHRYEHRFVRTETASEQWGSSFYSDLVVHGSQAIFPSDPQHTHELLLAYASVRQRGGQKP